MSFSEIEQAALTLSEQERVALVAKLLDTLPPDDLDIPDAEVLRREQELESGAVEPISQEEFVRLVQRERGR